MLWGRADFFPQNVGRVVSCPDGRALPTPDDLFTDSPFLAAKKSDSGFLSLNLFFPGYVIVTCPLHCPGLGTMPRRRCFWVGVV